MAKRALVSLGLMILFSGLACAQAVNVPRDTENSIRGKLIFTTPEHPENRIEVRLEKNMQQVSSTFTDSSGNFEFRGLAPGTYIINVAVDGFEPVRQQLDVYSTTRTASVAISMNRAFTVVRKEGGGFEGDDPDIVDVKLIAKTYPKKAVQAYEKALNESQKGETAKAIKLFEEAVTIAPDFYHAFNNLGVGYMKLDRYSNAEAAFRRALDLNPRAQQPLVNLGILYIKESDVRRPEGPAAIAPLLGQAREALERAVRLKPLSALAHLQLGTAYYKSDSYDTAEVSLKKARELDPKLDTVRLLLVNVYLKQKRWNDLIDQIDLYIKENPKAADRPALEDMRKKVVNALQAPKP